MEAEYTGWGVYLIAAVLGFNLMCLPLWFLVNNLSRTHDFALKKIETFLHLLEIERHKHRHKATQKDPELASLIDEIRERAEKAMGLGPLWGRKHATTAQLALHTLGEKWPELVEGVHRAMERPS
jgi:hypothetical protein